MSKSKGNVIAPQQVSDTLGAEILRLWVAATDYSGELTISERNPQARASRATAASATPCASCSPTPPTSTPATQMLPVDEWLEIDRYALAADARAAGASCRADYERYEFHKRRAGAAELLLRGPGRLLPRHPQGPPVHHGADSRARRSAQSALWHILQSLTRLMAPILSFTAEEIWQIAGDGDERDADDLACPAGRRLAKRRSGCTLATGDPRHRAPRRSKVLEDLREARAASAPRCRPRSRFAPCGETYDLLASARQTTAIRADLLAGPR